MKNFSFTFNLRNLLASSPPSQTPQAAPGLHDGLQRVTEFIQALAAGKFEQARPMLTPNFSAHEPALNKILTADEMIYNWHIKKHLFVQQRLDIKQTATFSVFGAIDRDKYVYIKADYHRTKFCSGQSQILPFELIARLDGTRIEHVLFCIGSSKAFDKLSSVQHARALAHAC